MTSHFLYGIVTLISLSSFLGLNFPILDDKKKRKKKKEEKKKKKKRKRKKEEEDGGKGANIHCVHILH